MAAYDYRGGFGGYQPAQGGFPYQPTPYLPQQQNAVQSQQAAPQQGFRTQPVASREEAMAIQTDFWGPGILMPCLGQGVIFLKRFNQETGASDLFEFVYAPPQQKPQPSTDFVPMNLFRELAQKVEQLEKGVSVSVPDTPHE